MPADQVLATALAFAKEITKNSPEAVQSTKTALLMSQEHGVKEAFRTHIRSLEAKRVFDGDNIKVYLVLAPFFGMLLSWTSFTDDPL